MLTAALALALAAAPPARTSPAAERVITTDSIRAHVRFLASDLLEGRGPGTRGDALAEPTSPRSSSRSGSTRPGPRASSSPSTSWASMATPT